MLRNSRQTGFKNIFTTDSGYNIKTFYSLNGNLLLNHLYKDKNVLEERKKKVRWIDVSILLQNKTLNGIIWGNVSNFSMFTMRNVSLHFVLIFI